MTDLALTYGSFAVFAALAALAQNATGFAFSLVLLGGVDLIGRVGLADAANAAMLLTLVQAIQQRRSWRATGPVDWLRPVLWGSLPGLLAGVALLACLQAAAVSVLQGLFGLVVLACAVQMRRPPRQLAQPSSRTVFWTTGLLSGLLGGLFASAGPPLVLQMHRQPVPFELVRPGLLLTFSVQAALRLPLVFLSGGLHVRSFALAVAALPAMALAEWLRRRGHMPRDPARLRLAVMLLLGLTGSSLLARAWA
jgi:hypothetical protein